MADTIKAWACALLRSKYPPTAYTGDVCWGKKSHLLVQAQQEPAGSWSCCACGLLASLLAFRCVCFPLVPAALSILISLCLFCWSSVIFWGCGPGRRLHFCWLQGMVLQWGPFSQRHSSFSFSRHQRNTPCRASPLLLCRQAGSKVVQGIPLSQFPGRDESAHGELNPPSGAMAKH